MRRKAPALLFALTLAAGPALGEERKSRPVPELKAAPKVDGDLGDWRQAMELSPASAGSATVKARVGWAGSTLYVGLTVDDEAQGADDAVDVSLFFAGAGPAARGFVYRFGRDGLRRFDDETAAPLYAQQLVEASARRLPKGWMAVEAAFPVRALPSFPVKGPLAFDLCLAYRGKALNCTGGSMGPTALRLPETFRSGAKVKAPEAVVALEGRPGGWVGYGPRHDLRWVRGDDPLTAISVAAMVTESPLSPEDVGMATPNLLLDGRKPIFFVLSGKDPQPGEGRCDATKEVRLSLYLVEGRTGVQVLECPAVTCALGRATAVILDDEGSLSIGYSGGSIANYSWSTDHFERTEYGMLSP